MSKQHITNLIFGVLCIGFLVYFFLPSSDEEEIRARIAALSESAAVTGAEHPFERLAKGRELSAFFTDPATILFSSKEGELREESLDRRELAQKIALYRGHFREASVSFSGLKVERSGESAHAALTVSGKAQGVEEGDSYRDSALLELRLLRYGGEWLISSVEHNEQ